MAIVHKVIDGGEQYLGWALARARALRGMGDSSETARPTKRVRELDQSDNRIVERQRASDGVTHSQGRNRTQIYDMGDATVEIRLVGEKTYIRLLGVDEAAALLGGFTCYPASELHPYGIDPNASPPVTPEATFTTRSAAQREQPGAKAGVVKEHKKVETGVMAWRGGDPSNPTIVTYNPGIADRYQFAPTLNRFYDAKPEFYVKGKKIATGTRNILSVAYCKDAGGYVYVAVTAADMRSYGVYLLRGDQHTLLLNVSAEPKTDLVHLWHFSPDGLKCASVETVGKAHPTAAGWPGYDVTTAVNFRANILEVRLTVDGTASPPAVTAQLSRTKWVWDNNTANNDELTRYSYLAGADYDWDGTLVPVVLHHETEYRDIFSTEGHSVNRHECWMTYGAVEVSRGVSDLRVDVVSTPATEEGGNTGWVRTDSSAADITVPVWGDVKDGAICIQVNVVAAKTTTATPNLIDDIQNNGAPTHTYAYSSEPTAFTTDLKYTSTSGYTKNWSIPGWADPMRGYTAVADVPRAPPVVVAAPSNEPISGELDVGGFTIESGPFVSNRGLSKPVAAARTVREVLLAVPVSQVAAGAVEFLAPPADISGYTTVACVLPTDPRPPATAKNPVSQAPVDVNDLFNLGKEPIFRLHPISIF